MIENNCQNCGNELFLKDVFADNYTYWCPYCTGFVPIDKENAQKLCEIYVKSSKKLASDFCSTFSRNHLISSSLNRRESSVIYGQDVIDIKIRDIIVSSLIIKDCLNGHHGGNQALSKENFATLFSHYINVINSENLVTQVSEEYVFIFEPHPDIELPHNQRMDLFEVNGSKYLALPSYKWGYFIDAVETVQLAPPPRRDKVKKQAEMRVRAHKFRMKKLELKLPHANKKVRIKLEQKILAEKENLRAETLSIVYNSMLSVYFNFNFFDFSEIKRDPEILKFIGSLTSHCNKIRLSQPTGLKNSNLYCEIGLDVFDYICSLQSLNYENMYEMLVSSEEDCKEFPLFVEENLNVLVCPEILFLVSSLIQFASNIEQYNSDLSFRGTEFESETCDVFESHAFSFEHPIHKKQNLTNKIITIEKNGKQIQREIDLLPYNDKYLFVIDCKRNSLKPDYILNNKQKNRAFGNDGIKDEIENKHIDRVNYFVDKQLEFGFKIKREVKGLIVTLIKEDIENHKGIDVIPFSDLNAYLKDF